MGKYKNPNTFCNALTNFRYTLKALNVSPEALKASERKDIWASRNATLNARKIVADETPLVVPSPFATVAALTRRVNGYLAYPDGWCNGQAAADFLVALSARPGEVETLELGEFGGVTGVLKKRDKANAYNLVSAIGTETAEKFLSLWKSTDIGTRRAAMRQLDPLVQGWGMRRKDLRKIGAHLAVRVAARDGCVRTAGDARLVRQAALRHDPFQAPVDYYTGVVDPVARLTALMSELSSGQIARLEALAEKMLEEA